MKTTLRAAVLAAGVALAGCAGGGPSPSAAPSQPPQSTPTATTAAATGPATTAEPSPTAIATASASAPASPASSRGSGELHPCTFLTSAQAGQVNGVAYGPGQEHPLEATAIPGVETGAPKSVECVWQNSAGHGSLTLQVVADTSPAGAAARRDALRASLHAFTVTGLPDFADGAFIARTTNPIATGGIYVVDGSVFFDLAYLQGTAPDDNALQRWAIEILGSLP